MADRASSCQTEVVVGLPATPAGYSVELRHGDSLLWTGQSGQLRTSDVALPGPPQQHRLTVALLRTSTGEKLATDEKTVQTRCAADAPWNPQPEAGLPGPCWKPVAAGAQPVLKLELAENCRMPDRGSRCDTVATVGFENAQPNSAAWYLYQDGEFVTSGTSNEAVQTKAIALSGQPKSYGFRVVVKDWQGRELFTREKTVQTNCPAGAPWYQPPLTGATGMCWARTYSTGGLAHVAIHRTPASSAVGGWQYPHRFGLNPDPASPGKYLSEGYSVPIENISSSPNHLNAGNTILFSCGVHEARLPEGFFAVVCKVASPDRGNTEEFFWVDPSAQFMTNFGLRLDVTSADIAATQFTSAYDPARGYATEVRVWSDYYQGTFYVPSMGYVPAGLPHNHLSYSIHFNPTADWGLTAAGQPPGFTVYDGVGKLPSSLGQINALIVATGLPTAPGQ